MALFCLVCYVRLCWCCMSFGLLCVKQKEQMLSARVTWLGSQLRVPWCGGKLVVLQMFSSTRSRNCLWFRTRERISPLAGMSVALVKHKPINKHAGEIANTQPSQICSFLLSCTFPCSAHTILLLYALWKTGTSKSTSVWRGSIFECSHSKPIGASHFSNYASFMLLFFEGIVFGLFLLLFPVCSLLRVRTWNRLTEKGIIDRRWC